MGNAQFYEPSFYLVNDKFSYTIRGEIELKENIDGAIFESAVKDAFRRYPYFSVQIVRKDEEYLCVPNDRTHLVLNSKDKVVLGSEQVNYHLVSVSYYENKVFFDLSHSLTDGSGRAPFSKTVLYNYLTGKYNIDIDPMGINMNDSLLFDDEDGNPYSEEKLKSAKNTFYKPIGATFKLPEATSDNIRRVYKFKAAEEPFMNFCRKNNASPSSLIAVLLAKALRKLHPEKKDDIICNICCNMRPSLGNKHSFRPLYGFLNITYTEKMNNLEISRLCSSTREMMRIQNQPENHLFQARHYMIWNKRVNQMKSIDDKRKFVYKALYEKGGLLSTPFWISYMGHNIMGSIEPFIESMYTTVDTYMGGGINVEITNVNGYFFFTFIQDFTSDVYMKAVTDELRSCGIPVEETGWEPVMAGTIQLPE